MAKSKLKWYQKTKTFRYITQGLILLFFLQLFIKQAFFNVGEVEAYCPFGGLETLYAYLTTGRTLQHVGVTNIVLFVLVVIITLLFRSGFCGWICPIGTYQEIVRKIGKKIGGLSFIRPLNKKYKKAIRNNKKTLLTIDRYLRYFKYFVLVWAVLGAIYYSRLVFRDYDPSAALIQLIQYEISIGLFIFAIITFLALFIDRPYCKYACPLGAIIGLIGKLSPLRVSRNEDLCTNCNLCSKSCQMGIDLSKNNYVNSTACIHCFDCIDACPVEGAIDLKFMPKEIYTTSKVADNFQELRGEKQ